MSSPKLELLYVINISESWEGSYWLHNIIIFLCQMLSFHASHTRMLGVTSQWVWLLVDLKAPYIILKSSIFKINSSYICYFCLQKGIYGGCFPFHNLVSEIPSLQVSLFDILYCDKLFVYASTYILMVMSNWSQKF